MWLSEVSWWFTKKKKRESILKGYLKYSWIFLCCSLSCVSTFIKINFIELIQCIIISIVDLSIHCFAAAAAAAKLLESCRTLCDPIDGSPPGSPVPVILQARTLEWVAISLSNAWKWKVKVKSLSHVRLFATPWTATYQTPPSIGFSKQEYWSGVPSPSPRSFSTRI